MCEAVTSLADVASHHLAVDVADGCEHPSHPLVGGGDAGYLGAPHQIQGVSGDRCLRPWGATRGNDPALTHEAKHALARHGDVLDRPRPCDAPRLRTVSTLGRIRSWRRAPRHRGVERRVDSPMRRIAVELSLERIASRSLRRPPCWSVPFPSAVPGGRPQSGVLGKGINRLTARRPQEDLTCADEAPALTRVELADVYNPTCASGFFALHDKPL